MFHEGSCWWGGTGTSEGLCSSSEWWGSGLMTHSGGVRVTPGQASRAVPYLFQRPGVIINGAGLIHPLMGPWPRPYRLPSPLLIAAARPPVPLSSPECWPQPFLPHDPRFSPSDGIITHGCQPPPPARPWNEKPAVHHKAPSLCFNPLTHCKLISRLISSGLS